MRFGVKTALKHAEFSCVHGFTLAEVLITLGIIGVVAAMTLPSVINDAKDKAVISQLKKEYSVLSQALLRAKNEHEDYVYWNIVDYDMTSTTEIFTYIKPYLKIVKECPNQTMGCWHQVTSLKDANIHNAAGMGDSVYNFILADGARVSMNIYSSDSDRTMYGVTEYALSPFIGFWVDVNGSKKPNKLGRDVFLFILTTKGLLPAGTDNESSDCKVGDFGYTCAAKVLNEGKINY